MRKWWNRISVSSKLYFTLLLFFVVIAIELVALKLSIDGLSTVRAYLSGESRWAKSQKNAVNALYMYSMSENETYFNDFLKHAEVILDMKRGREEIEKKDFSYITAEQYFRSASAPPEDIPYVINSFRRYSNTPVINPIVLDWKKGDELFQEILIEGENIRQFINQGISMRERIKTSLKRVTEIDNKLSIVEREFVLKLREVAESAEKFFLVLVGAILVTFFIGLIVVLFSGRVVTKWLAQFIRVANLVGNGDLNQNVTVDSDDEFGKAATAFNMMIASLKAQTNERLSAEHASLAKNIFLANMSHEIRTPLNSILGFSEILRDTNLNAQEREQYAGIIQRTGMSLMTIIRDILDIARIEAEKISIETSVFSIEQLLLDLKELLRLRCSEKGIDLIFEKQGDISVFIRSDLTRVRQILLNLLGNAIKFTDRGSIQMRYYIEDNHLVFNIRDTGSGIANDQLISLFRPFSQGDNSVRKRYGGTGLGLMISKRLAQLLGGDVRLLHSQVGEGSTFEVRIDYQQVEKSQPHEDSQTEKNQDDYEKIIEGKKILLVEDSVDNQILINIHLSRCGAKVEIVSDGLQALEKCSANVYDLIIMDMQMPVMDGYSTTRKLRKRNYNAPILALTGFAMKGDEEKCLQAGCTVYLSKPFDRLSLLTAVGKTLKT